MFKVLIIPCIGVVLILCLRTHKQNETIPVFRYEQREEIYNGDSTTYLKECWSSENRERKDSESLNSN